MFIRAQLIDSCEMNYANNVDGEAQIHMIARKPTTWAKNNGECRGGDYRGTFR